MLIEGILADQGSCDIAIDDLILFNGACSGMTSQPPFVCGVNGTQTISRDLVCDHVSDCDDGSDEADCGTESNSPLDQ